MNILNNRYKIIEQLQLDTKEILVFFAEDLWNHKSFNFDLKIINSSVIETECMNVLKDNFLFIKRLNSPFHFKNYKFTRLFSVDGTKLADDSFIYMHEHIEDKIVLTDYLKTASADSKLQIIVQLCKAFNYLAGYGLGYNELGLSDIFVINGSEKLSIKITDIVTSIFEHSLMIVESENSDVKNFEYEPEMLTKLFIAILAGEDTTALSAEYFEKIKTDYSAKKQSEKDKQITDCLFDICDKLLQRASGSSPYLLHEIIKDINKTLKTDFSVTSSEYTENNSGKKILKIEERENEKREIIADFYKLQNLSSADTVFFVQGQDGIGKTNFLNGLYFLFSLEKCNVYAIPDLSGFDEENFILYMMQSLFLNTSTKNNALFEQGMQESFDFFTQQKENADIPIDDKNDKKKYKFINRISNLLHKGMATGFNVFIVDDIHLASKFMLDIFFSLTADFTNQKKAVFIFSYNKLNIAQNKYAEKFVNVLTEQPGTKTIQLYNLSENNISALIKNILGVKYIPEVLTKKLYSYTDGSLNLAVEVIQRMLDSGDIKKDPDSELCILSEKILNPVIPIHFSSNTEQLIDESLNGIDNDKAALLNTMGMFKINFTVDTIATVTGLDPTYIQLCILEFLKQGFLKEYSTPDSILYGIIDHSLQKVLYDRSDDSYKLQIHKKIVRIMNRSRGVYPAEMIWHAERAHLQNIAVNYCLRNEPLIKKRQTATDYVSIFEQLYHFIPENNVEKKVKILLLIAKVYYDLEKGVPSEDKIRTAEFLIEKHDIDKNLIAELYMLKVNIQILMEKDNTPIEQTLKTANSKLKKMNDFYIDIRLLYIKIKISEYRNKLRKAINDAKKLINLCGSDKQLINIKIEIMLKLGNYLYNMQSYNEAKAIYKDAFAAAEKHNILKIRYAALNNLALLYSNYDHDYTAAAQCYNRIINSKDNLTDSSIKVLARLNLALLNMLIGHYLEAYELCGKTIKEIKQHSLYQRLPFAYVLMYEITAALGRFDLALAYKRNSERLLKNEQSLKYRGYLLSFYQTTALLHGSFGDYGAEAKFLNNMLGKIQNSEYSVYEPFVLFRLEINKLTSFKTNSIDDLAKRYGKLMKKKNTELVHLAFKDIIICMRAVITKRFDLNFKKIIKNLLEEDISAFPDGLIPYILFFKSYQDSKNEETYLLQANAALVQDQSGELSVNIKTSLGLFYFNHHDIYTALVFFIEAQTEIKRLFTRIPEKDRLKFFNTNNYYLPFQVVNDYLDKTLKPRYVPERKTLTNTEMQVLLQTDTAEVLRNNFDFMEGLVANNLSKKGFENKTAIKIVREFSTDFMHNIKLLAEFTAANLLATAFDVFVIDTDNNTESLFNFNKNAEIKKIHRIIKDFGYDKFNFSQTEGALSHLVIPLSYKNNFQANEYITGYLVFISDKVINNFGKFGETFYTKLKNIFAFLIESLKTKQEASTDKLTSVLTRKYIDAAFEDLLDISRENNKSLSVLMFDLDHFKRINDTFGHQAGDTVLKATTAVVSQALNKEQLVGRLGGEEFLVLLPNTGIDEALSFAEKIRKQIELLNFENPAIKITVSIGVSAFPQHGLTKQTLLSMADQALYKAKNSGRNRVCIWQGKMEETVLPTNKMDGVLTGDIIKDIKNISDFIGLISLIRRNVSETQRQDLCLEKIIDITGAERGIFIPVKAGKVRLKDRHTGPLKHSDFYLNNEFVKEVLTEKSGLYRIDWDNAAEKNNVSEMPVWNSVLIAPIIRKERIVSLVYLTVSMRKKEFGSDDLNLVNFLSECIAPFF